MQIIMLHMTFASLVVLAAGIFTSVSFSAIGHILLAPPALYFAFKKFDLKNMPKSWYALIALIIFIALSVVFNWSDMHNPAKNLLKAKYFILPLLGVFAYREMFREYLKDKKLRILLWLFLIATTIATLSGLIGLLSGFNPLKMKKACHATRACGLYGMYMTYGYGISFFATMMAGWFLRRKEIPQIPSWLGFSSLGVNILGMILSFARGGWLAFIGSLPFYFLKKNKRNFLIGLVSGFLILGISFAAIPKVRDVFFKRSESNQQRLALYKTAWHAFKEKPILGWGYRNFEPNTVAIKEKYEIDFPSHSGHAHNNLIEHLASTGLLGFLATLGFFLLWLFESYKGDDLVSFFTFPFIINFLISGMFQYTFGDGENMFFIMTVYAIFVATRKQTGFSHEQC